MHGPMNVKLRHHFTAWGNRRWQLS